MRLAEFSATLFGFFDTEHHHFSLLPSMNSRPSIECSLDGAIARSVRASEHLRDLIARIEALRQEQVDAIAIGWDDDPERLGEPKLLFSRYVTIPLSFGILVGEACYNLRAALDYLVYELAILDTGGIVEGTQFPIEDRQKNFAWWQNGRLSGLHITHIAAIENLQPYRGCNWTKLLRSLSNPDKHRRLIFSQGSFQARIFAHTERLRFLAIPGKETRALHPVSGEPVNVKVDIALEVQFIDGTPVIQALHEIQTQVAQTLEAFKGDFNRAAFFRMIGGGARGAPTP